MYWDKATEDRVSGIFNQDDWISLQLYSMISYKLHINTFKYPVRSSSNYMYIYILIKVWVFFLFYSKWSIRASQTLVVILDTLYIYDCLKWWGYFYIHLHLSIRVY